MDDDGGFVTKPEIRWGSYPYLGMWEAELAKSLLAEGDTEAWSPADGEGGGISDDEGLVLVGKH